MIGMTIYPLQKTPALDAACEALRQRGVTIAELPGKSVTHVLLPIPRYDQEELARILPEMGDVTMIGGDRLLKDERYLAENAAITADCAIRIAAQKLPTVFRGCPVLVIGWGRIGKCLADQLRRMGADVTVAARQEAHLAALASLGYTAIPTDRIETYLLRYRILFNTVPAPILSSKQLTRCPAGSILIDLASQQGMEGDPVVWARGLPGKMAPEAVGQLMASTILRLVREGRL